MKFTVLKWWDDVDVIGDRMVTVESRIDPVELKWLKEVTIELEGTEYVVVNVDAKKAQRLWAMTRFDMLVRLK